MGRNIAPFALGTHEPVWAKYSNDTEANCNPEFTNVADLEFGSKPLIEVREIKTVDRDPWMDAQLVRQLEANTQVHVRDSLRRLPIIVAKHAAQSFTAIDLAAALPHFLARLNDLVLQSLVIPLSVIVFEIRSNGPS